MKWHSTIRTVRISSLRLSGGFTKRLEAAHVAKLAGSLQEVGPINLPVVCWNLKGKKLPVREVAAGEDRIAATLVANGGKWDASIEVRAFDGTADDIRRVRAHENAHRRHDDRDAWLAGLVAAETREVAVSERRGGELTNVSAPDDPSEAKGGGAHPGDASGSPENTAPHEVIHKWVHDQPLERSCGAGLATERKTGAWELVTCEACLADGRKYGSVEDEPASPSAAEHATDGAFFVQPVVYEDVATQGVTSQVVTAEPAKPTKLLGAKRRQAAKAASEQEGKEITPAAVKQAEYRERLKKGAVNSRQKHDDSGAPLPESAEPVLRGLIDTAHLVTSALTRLTNLCNAHPVLGLQFSTDQARFALKELAAQLRSYQPHAPCVYCLTAKDQPCQGCKDRRWLTKDEMANAPEELVKAAGL